MEHIRNVIIGGMNDYPTDGVLIKGLLKNQLTQGTEKTIFVHVCTARSQAADALPFLPCSTKRVAHLF